jgi:hypothetical protein
MGSPKVLMEDLITPLLLGWEHKRVVTRSKREQEGKYR